MWGNIAIKEDLYFADCFTENSNCEDDGSTNVKANLTSIDDCCGANEGGVGTSFRHPLDGTCYNCGSELSQKCVCRKDTNPIILQILPRCIQ